MGGSTRSYEIAKKLVLAGHQVSVVTSTRGQDYARTVGLNVEGIEIVWINVDYNNSMSFWRRVYAFGKFAILSYRIGSKLDGDLVYATSTPLTIAIPGVLTSKRCKIPLIFEVRDVWPDIPIAMKILTNRFLIKAASLLELWAYRNSRKIVGLSPGMCDSIISKGIASDRVICIPNAANVAKFQNTASTENIHAPKSITEADQVVLYAGTLGTVNGVSYMIDIAKELDALDKANKIKFLVVGDGVEKNKLIHLASDLKLLNRRVFFLDPIAKQAMPTLFARASIVTSFIINVPILEMNSANKFFDGLAAGRPILINHGGWQADIITKYNAGLVIDRDDAFSAAQSLLHTLNDTNLLTQMGRNSLGLAKSQFDSDILFDRLVSEIVDTAADTYT